MSEATAQTALIVIAIAVSVQTILMVAGAIAAMRAWRKVRETQERYEAFVARVDTALVDTREAARAVQRVSDEAAATLGDLRHATRSVVGVVAAPRSLLVAGATSAAGALLSRWRKRRQEHSWRDR
ncbi:MAG TPA: hypothetical protein VFO19_22525 [Vicinamibacterales bacterium]|nr:hypothetical protein [Vicinamibacterales bacterium]